MSLLTDIIQEATEGGDVAKLLRKCMRLAHLLNSDELATWAASELKGYADDADLPAYRKLGCGSKARVIGPLNAWQGVFEVPLSVLPAELRPLYESVQARQSIAHFESLAKADTADGQLQQPWPPEVARRYVPKAFATGSQCISAWNVIAQAEVQAMVDQVLSRVLEFALALSKEFPELSRSDQAIDEGSAREKHVTQNFHTTIMGSVGNFAAGSSAVSQSAEVHVVQGDIESLKTALAQAGLSTPQIAELEKALAEDREAGAVGIGAKVKAWLGDLTAACATGAADAVSTAAISTVGTLVAKYFGLA